MSGISITYSTTDAVQFHSPNVSRMSPVIKSIIAMKIASIVYVYSWPLRTGHPGVLHPIELEYIAVIVLKKAYDQLGMSEDLALWSIKGNAFHDSKHC